MCVVEKILVMWINRIFTDMGAGEWDLLRSVLLKRGSSLESPGKFMTFWALDPISRDYDLTGLERGLAPNALKAPQVCLWVLKA